MFLHIPLDSWVFIFSKHFQFVKKALYIVFVSLCWVHMIYVCMHFQKLCKLEEWKSLHVFACEIMFSCFCCDPQPCIYNVLHINWKVGGKWEVH